MRLPLIVATCSAVLLISPVPARAAGFTLSWDAPSDCPSEASVRAEVARWLDSSTRAAGDTAVVANADVARTADGYELVLQVTTPSGSSRKRMVSRRCETFAEVIALELSLAAPPPGGTAAAGGETEEGENELPSRSQSELIVGGRVLAGLGSGPTPGFAPALGLAATLRLAPLRFELGASYGPAISARYAMPDDVGADFELFAGSGRACYALASAPAELPLCVGGEFGVVSARGFGVEGAVRVERDWAAVLLVQGVRWPSAGPISAWLEGSAALALLRPAFRIRNLEQLHRTAPLVFRAAVGIELQID